MKILPKFAIFIFLLLVVFYILPITVFAQSATSIPSPTSIPLSIDETGPLDNTWVRDADVTFVGKAGARSGDFLDWTIRSYKWSSGFNDGLASFWVTIRNLVYLFFIVAVMISAFIFIVSRGRNLRVKQLMPRFILVILLVTFSFALIQLLYQVVDIIQEFFLRMPATVPPRSSPLISQSDLLFIGFDYKEFIGYRLSGMANDESAFVALLLVKLTTITYYLMAGLLILRKIILWFFIFVSPILPLLLLFSPIRNTAKIWVGEFFRWLLYGPIFAILLAGLVALWKSPAGIPLTFTPADPNNPSSLIYPTAINILLGGPGQTISIANSVNIPDTFAQYVVALIMLWVVILLPFLLLKILLDSFHDFSFSEQSIVQKISANLPFVGKLSSFVSSLPSVPPKIPPPTSTGMARELPFTTRVGTASGVPKQQTFSQPVRTTISSPVTTTISTQNMSQIVTNILKSTNMSVPTIRDIARFDANTITNTQSTQQESSRVNTILEKIANPRTATTTEQRDTYRVVRDQLITEKQKGNPVASSLLSAASVSAEGVVAGGTPSATFPVVNRVQNVSLEDYESVKKLWQENYTRLEPSKSVDGIVRDRKEWVGEDVKKVEETINKLQSNDPKMVKEGMNMVSSILPFLLVGGFSQTEIIAYLRAKLEAGKSTLSDIDKKQDNEDTLLEEGLPAGRQVEEPKTLEASINPEEKPLEQSVQDSTYDKTIV